MSHQGIQVKGKTNRIVHHHTLAQVRLNISNVLEDVMKDYLVPFYDY